MKTKLLLSALFGMAAWSLSSVAAANWDTGACPTPNPGPAPCIETVVNGNTYHFNGSGGHADVWHGLPAAEGGGDFSFSGNSVLACESTEYACTMESTGQVKKCEDSNGNWRIGVRVNSFDVSGPFTCHTFAFSGFPWYSKDSSITPHCPFEDDCDFFSEYDPNASTYTANLGPININVFGSPKVTNGHMHGVVFTPGVAARVGFDSRFYDCNENDQGCSVDGEVILDNATSLDIY
jgi:hypothetical protein